ncbi:MAG: hypothetical protein WA979_01320 [Pacificimonas sp.]
MRELRSYEPHLLTDHDIGRNRYLRLHEMRSLAEREASFRVFARIALVAAIFASLFSVLTGMAQYFPDAFAVIETRASPMIFVISGISLAFVVITQMISHHKYLRNKLEILELWMQMEQKLIEADGSESDEAS